jgi:hypothetical protein
MVLGIVGGAMLFIGSFLTWATASIDIAKFAQALGVDQSLLQGAMGATPSSFTVSGMNADADGKFTLVAGIAVLIFAVVLFIKADLGKVMGGLMVLAGLIGGGVAIYDLSKLNDVRNDALASVGPSLQSAGVDPNILEGVFKVSAGIGIYLCALGGILAVVAGIMALVSRKPEPAAAGAMGATPGYARTSPLGSGFQSSTPPPAPAAPMTEPPDSPAPSEPPAPPAISEPPVPAPTPEPPPIPPSGETSGGGATTD